MWVTAIIKLLEERTENKSITKHDFTNYKTNLTPILSFISPKIILLNAREPRI